MNTLRSVTGAFGWVVLFLGSSIIICVSALLIGINTDIEFLNRGVYSYYIITESLSNGNLATLLFNHEVMVEASNFTLMLTFLSYVPVLVFAGFKFLGNKNNRKDIDLNLLLLCVSAAMFLNLAIELMSVLLSPLATSEATETFEFTMTLATGGNQILVFLIAGLVAPIIEEAVLRGGVQKNLQKMNPTMAILVTSLLFGFLHGNLIQGLAATVFGFLLGYVYYKTNNLFYNILMHMCVNTTGCIIMVTNTPAIAMYVLFAVVSLIVYLIYNKTNPTINFAKLES